ncbi:hypothetical protein Y1Q_0005147 [Alligator mississippiensis]|uniref:Uncharacterized protein n=1 Tax=Alligator mississippiensis TaxID=8496 RepID=A0A151MUN4_ALLMI|nr:hypothetical protein Y1Q_0005147 [Alligator mississippiensis]
MELAQVEAAVQPVLASGVSFLSDLKGNCSLFIWNMGVRDSGTYGVWVSATHPPGRKVRPNEERHQWWIEIKVEVAGLAPILGTAGHV